MLAGNQLTDLPLSMSQCSDIELLRISSNKFKKLPDWLFELPRLSWFAYSGNPLGEEDSNYICNNDETVHKTIKWSDIEILDKIIGLFTIITGLITVIPSNQSSD
jgi:Leucine-rich repeat (LRR) protein